VREVLFSTTKLEAKGRNGKTKQPLPPRCYKNAVRKMPASFLVKGRIMEITSVW
jgi:hypothetical protein